MLDAVTVALQRDARILFALAFGSVARGQAHALSDLDVAIGLAPGQRLSAAEVGRIVADLEAVTGRDVDLVLLGEAPIPLRFAVFRDGIELFVRDRPELVRQKARAIVDWLDFQPTHEILVAGALRAASRG
jgi:predicted nucleotidyltransferase